MFIVRDASSSSVINSLCQKRRGWQESYKRSVIQAVRVFLPFMPADMYYMEYLLLKGGYVLHLLGVAETIAYHVKGFNIWYVSREVETTSSKEYST